MSFKRVHMRCTHADALKGQNAPAVAVVGGGITGLAAAYELSRSGARVVVFEASDRLGGKILTTEFAGRPVDAGADAFLARHPAAVELCRELGLGDRLISPATQQASVLIERSLRPFPSRTLLGVPTDLDAVASSGLLTEAGLVRMAADLAATATPLADGSDAPIGALVRDRLGDEALDRLVGPLVGGINAGDPDRLSIRACTPQLAAAAAHPSLIRGARAVAAEAALDPQSPVFFGLPLGMEELVSRLTDTLSAADVELRLGEPVTRIAPGAHTRWSVSTERRTEPVDAIVVAAPAPAAAPLLAPLSPVAAERLAAIEYASVVLVTMAFAARAIRHRLDGSGFLVPSTSDRLTTACSWTSSKWAHRSGPVIVRVSAGRAGDERALELDDADLVARLHHELAPVIGLTGDPQESRINRWPRSFPQYAVGHLDRVAVVEAALAADAPGVVVAGAALRGLGIPACIDQGRRAAADALAAARLANRPA
jgi:oxygen-dependent protoporphyrinogen oxidase